MKLYKSIKTRPETVKITKTWLFYSYGYMFNTIAANDHNAFTTPFGYIPVDMPYLYLSNSDYEALPTIAKFTKVVCRVKLLGTRTAFDYGTSLSGVANTEHVHIAGSIIGLNRLLSGFNGSYSSTPTDPMKVTSALL